MKRTVVLFAALVIVLAPSPAFAWFGWLDGLSGPGPWFGALFEFRVKCFGPEQAPDAITSAVAALRNFEDEKTESDPSTRLGSLKTAWANVIDIDTAVLNPAIRRLLTESELAALTDRIDAVQSAGVGMNAELARKAPTEDVRKAANALATELRRLAEHLQILEPNFKPRRMAAAGTGVIVERCGNIVRRSSIDIAGDVWFSTSRKPEFANGEGIQLYTVRVAYSYAFVRNATYNILDGSIGAGYFVFRSDGFDDDDGLSDQRRNVFIEPIRLYLHAPAHWGDERAPWWKQLLSVPVLSAAATFFPRGFDANVFGQHEAIGPELVPSISVYVNAKSIFGR